jgi:predicted nucleic acid-binding protein
MAQMIQVRNVPEALHRGLKARAATMGMSLSDYLLGELREIAERPTLLNSASDCTKTNSFCSGHRQYGERGTCDSMIVLDASATVDWLLQTPAGQLIERRIYARNDTLHTVHLLDVEIAQVLRRLVREKTLAPRRAEEAIEDLSVLRVTRYAPVLMLKRIWRLRPNLSAYDAAYVALAEELTAPLITRDRRIAMAPGHTAAVEVF